MAAATVGPIWLDDAAVILSCNSSWYKYLTLLTFSIKAIIFFIDSTGQWEKFENEQQHFKYFESFLKNEVKDYNLLQVK